MLAEEAEELDGVLVGGAEPVRGAGVELGGLAGAEDEVVLGEDEAESAVEDVDPLVALVGLRLGAERRERPAGITILNAWMPTAWRVSGTIVMPCAFAGRRWMRGSPVGGASTSSSSVTS